MLPEKRYNQIIKDGIVVVVGGCGHVGLPFAVACAQKYYTIGLDISVESVKNLNNWQIPFIEEGLEEPFEKAIQSKQLGFTNTDFHLMDAKYIAVTIGTPVDEEGNARLDDILDFFKRLIKLYHQSNLEVNRSVYIMLRSTVSPGTTEVLRNLIKDAKLKINVHLAFCPERSAQGVAYRELHELPQILGTEELNPDVEKEFIDFYMNIGCPKVVLMTSREAEVAKLVTNMSRYVNFALANEFSILADKFEVDINRIIDGAKVDYPRLAYLPTPGPNVGGPCLFKDGKFLLKNAPFNGLIASAFSINEGMPQFIYDKAIEFYTLSQQAETFVKKKPVIGILGMTFKAESDDTRNSLSFKLKKIAKASGYEVLMHDPFVKNCDSFEFVCAADIVFIMTPHSFYTKNACFFKQGGIIVDPWKLLENSKLYNDGMWRNEFYG